MSAFDAVGRQYGMTGDQVIHYLARGDVRHPDAEAGECGATDPRDNARWCRQPAGHEGNHNRYRPEDLI